MEVNYINNISFPLPHSVETTDITLGKPRGAEKADASFVYPKEESMGDKVREQVMMNLEEVQNFLYMLIGSKLRVQSDHHSKSIGTSINTAA